MCPFAFGRSLTFRSLSGRLRLTGSLARGLRRLFLLTLFALSGQLLSPCLGFFAFCTPPFRRLLFCGGPALSLGSRPTLSLRLALSLAGDPCRLFGSRLTPGLLSLGGGNTPFSLAGGSLGLGFFPGLFRLLACRLGSRFLTSLFRRLAFRLGSFASLFHLDGHEAVDFGIDLGIFLLMLGYQALYGLLLTLQPIHSLLLLILLGLQLALCLLALVEQLVFGALGLLQLAVLLVQFLLFLFDEFALRPLVCRIFAHEAQASVSLRQTLGTEDEHQLILYGPVLTHVTHRLDIFLLALIKLALECAYLRAQDTDIIVQTLDFRLEALDGLLLVVDLAIDDHEILQALRHVGLVGLQLALLHLDFLLDLGALRLQSLDLVGGIRLPLGTLLAFLAFLLFARGFGTLLALLLALLHGGACPPLL